MPQHQIKLKMKRILYLSAWCIPVTGSLAKKDGRHLNYVTYQKEHFGPYIFTLLNIPQCSKMLSICLSAFLSLHWRSTDIYGKIWSAIYAYLSAVRWGMIGWVLIRGWGEKRALASPKVGEQLSEEFFSKGNETWQNENYRYKCTLFFCTKSHPRSSS